jgi:protein-disulfide isomerase
MRKPGRLVLMLLGLATWAVGAELPECCQALDGDDLARAQGILSTEHPYDCCDDTIAACLERQPTCRLAWRLAANVCRRVEANEDSEHIRRVLSRRARSMLPSPSLAEVSLDGAPSAGDLSTPVEIVVYACPRCPYCSQLVPRLYRSIAEGCLDEQAHMFFKTFPGRSHPYSKEGGLAFLAAQNQGRFWDYALYCYQRFDEFSPDRLSAWAGELGLDVGKFETAVADPATRDALVESKKEGLRNGVEETPAVFINGRRFVGDLTIEELIDAVGEEHDRITGNEHIAG